MLLHYNDFLLNKLNNPSNNRHSTDLSTRGHKFFHQSMITLARLPRSLNHSPFSCAGYCWRSCLASPRDQTALQQFFWHQRHSQELHYFHNADGHSFYRLKTEPDSKWLQHITVYTKIDAWLKITLRQLAEVLWLTFALQSLPHQSPK